MKELKTMADVEYFGFLQYRKPEDAFHMPIDACAFEGQ